MDNSYACRVCYHYWPSTCACVRSDDVTSMRVKCCVMLDLVNVRTHMGIYGFRIRAFHEEHCTMMMAMMMM